MDAPAHMRAFDADSNDYIAREPGADAVVLENVTRRYSRLPANRAEQFFSRFGGIIPDTALFDEPFEDESFDDEENDDLRSDAAGVALDGISLTFAAGTCVAVVGPEGAGKTLLLRMIAGLTPLSEGRITVNGRVGPALEIVGSLLPKTARIPDALGVMAAMVGLHPRMVKRRVPRILDFAEATELARRHANSLSPQRRRDLVLATMLVLGPEVVLIDGTLNRGPLWDRSLERIDLLTHRGSLVVVTSRQEDAIATFSHRVIRLDRGRVVGDESLSPAPSS